MHSALLTSLLADIGSSDCEELRDGALAQPVNAITSLAYTLVGIGVILARPRGRQAVVDRWIYGLCLTFVGVGSVLFHGPQPPGSRLLHDLPITLTVFFIVVHNLALLVPRLPSTNRVFAGAAIAASVVSAISLDAVAALTGVGVAAIAVSETLIARRRLRPEDDRRRLATVIIIGITGVAAATWILGRTDSPACDPDSVVQLHALWHLLSAAVFGLWWWSAFVLGRSADEGSTEQRHPVRT